MYLHYTQSNALKPSIDAAAEHFHDLAGPRGAPKEALEVLQKAVLSLAELRVLGPKDPCGEACQELRRRLSKGLPIDFDVVYCIARMLQKCFSLPDQLPQLMLLLEHALASAAFPAAYVPIRMAQFEIFRRLGDSLDDQRHAHGDFYER